MKKTIAENVVIDFKNDLSNLKNITGWEDKELADKLGCSCVTISRMRKDPFSVSAQYVLLVRGYLERENMKRKGYI